jgi:hypothetical protein
LNAALFDFFARRFILSPTPSRAPARSSHDFSSHGPIHRNAQAQRHHDGRTLLKWRKNEGDKVETGDIIAEIETDKATMEMEAFDDGILHKHLVAPGEKGRHRQSHRDLATKGRKAAC